MANKLKKISKLNNHIWFLFGNIILIFLLVLFFNTVWSKITNQLDYNWNWSLLYDYRHLLMSGFLTTIRICIWSMVLAVFFGICLCYVRLNFGVFGLCFVHAMVSIMRGVPSLVIIFMVYFFLTQPLGEMWQALSVYLTYIPGYYILFGELSHIENTMTGIAVLSLIFGVYLSEIFRSAINSLPRGQIDAGYLLGLPKHVMIFKVYLPLLLKSCLIPMMGILMALIKDSALVSLISIQEFTFAGTEVAASSRLLLEVWLLVALGYGFLCTTLWLASKFIDSKSSL